MLPTARAIKPRRPWAFLELHVRCLVMCSSVGTCREIAAQPAESGWVKAGGLLGSVRDWVSQPEKGQQELESGTGHEGANQCDFHLIRTRLRTSPAHVHPSRDRHSWQTNRGTLHLSPRAGYKFQALGDEHTQVHPCL